CNCLLLLSYKLSARWRGERLYWSVLARLHDFIERNHPRKRALRLPPPSHLNRRARSVRHKRVLFRHSCDLDRPPCRRFLISSWPVPGRVHVNTFRVRSSVRNIRYPDSAQPGKRNGVYRRNTSLFGEQGLPSSARDQRCCCIGVTCSLVLGAVSFAGC